MVSAKDVECAFRLLLGREPESEAVTIGFASGVGSLCKLRDALLCSDEYRLGNSVMVGRYQVSKSYMSGDVIVDVGYRGEAADAVPVLPQAIGVDVNFPGYDGRSLPFPDNSVDTLYSSHVLEHVDDYRSVICDWHRVVKVGGFIVCIVPHQFLHEMKKELPSTNPDHKRFYTPASLLREFEDSLEPNTYRVRHLYDNDRDYQYELGPEKPNPGRSEIELVVQKIERPLWDLL